jgi:hypothetical protein
MLIPPKGTCLLEGVLRAWFQPLQAAAEGSRFTQEMAAISLPARVPTCAMDAAH